MMKGILFRISSALLILMPLGVLAQDFHLSQDGTAPLHLNPAMTGKTDGTFRAHGHYRSQWSSLTPNPFTTSLFSMDIPIGRWGTGVYIRKSQAGQGGFGVFNALLSGSYEQKLDGEGKHRMVLGVQGGLAQKSVNPEQLTFETQYTRQNGGGFDRSLSNEEDFQNTSITMPDLNAGLLYYFSKESSLFQPFLGASVSHILEPEESFFSASNELPRRYLVHAGSRIALKEGFQLMAKGMAMQQENNREYRFGLLGHFLLESGAYFIIGPNWRLRDAVVMETGVRYDSYQVRFSYDINTSSLQPSTSGQGGFEISLIYTGFPPEPEPVERCPRF